MDENGFEGRVGIETASASGAINMFFNVKFQQIPSPSWIPFTVVKVVNIEVGETTWEPPSITGTFEAESKFIKI